MMGLGWIFTIIVLGLGVWAFTQSIQKTVTPQLNGKTGMDALDILKLRYAKGEISKQEYLRMRKELN